MVQPLAEPSNRSVLATRKKMPQQWKYRLPLVQPPSWKTLSIGYKTRARGKRSVSRAKSLAFPIIGSLRRAGLIALCWIPPAQPPKEKFRHAKMPDAARRLYYYCAAAISRAAGGVRDLHENHACLRGALRARFTARVHFAGGVASALHFSSGLEIEFFTRLVLHTGDGYIGTCTRGLGNCSRSSGVRRGDRLF